MAVLDCGRQGVRAVCLGWGLVNAAFEVGQHPLISAWLAPRIPDFFDHFWLLKQTRYYFTKGTFDPLDLVGVGLGGLTAYALSLKTERRIKTS